MDGHSLYDDCPCVMCGAAWGSVARMTDGSVIKGMSDRAVVLMLINELKRLLESGSEDWDAMGWIALGLHLMREPHERPKHAGSGE